MDLASIERLALCTATNGDLHGLLAMRPDSSAEEVVSVAARKLRETSRSMRVGLLATANIAKKASKAVAASGFEIVAVASRDPTSQKAKSFLAALQNEIPETHGTRLCTYDELVTADDIEVVYVPIPVTMRDEWVLKCLSAGKHVVGEKPAAPNGSTLEGWLAAARSKSLMYMDGTMFSHGTRIWAVKRRLAELGAIRRMTFTFSFQGGPDLQAQDIRCNPTLEPHGAIGDLGWYCVRAALHLMDFAEPIRVSGRALTRGSNGALLECSGELDFRCPLTGGTVVASLYCSFITGGDQTLNIACENGTLVERDFVLPFTDRSSTGFTCYRSAIAGEGCQVKHSENPTTHHIQEESPSFQEEQLWRDACLAMGPSEDARAMREHWATLASKTQQIVDQWMEACK